MQLSLKEIEVANNERPELGQLVFADGYLVAVLVQMSESDDDDLGGCWYMDGGFGPLRDCGSPHFKDLDRLLEWARNKIGNDAQNCSERFGLSPTISVPVLTS